MSIDKLRMLHHIQDIQGAISIGELALIKSAADIAPEYYPAAMLRLISRKEISLYAETKHREAQRAHSARGFRTHRYIQPGLWHQLSSTIKGWFCTSSGETIKLEN